MARKQYKPILIDSVKAAANLTEHTFVKFDGNTCTAGAKAYGVVDVTTEKDQLAPVGVFGIFLVISGGAISVGDAVSSDANGKAVVATADTIVSTTTGDTTTYSIQKGSAINGYALDSASGAGEEIRILRGF